MINKCMKHLTFLNRVLFIYFSQFISFFYFILSILYTIFKFIVNLDFFDIGISFNLN